MDNKEAFIAFRKAFIEAFKADPDYRKAKASGNFERTVEGSDSYTITEGGNRFIQRGPVYTPYIDVGIKGNKGSKGAIAFGVYDWLRFKKYGLDWKTEAERKSIAWAVATNIVNDGSYKRRNPAQRTDIIKDATDKALPTLLDGIREGQLMQVSSEVAEEIKKINKEWQ